MRRAARILGLATILSSTAACQQELDSTPAPDPLEDPWVHSIDEGESEPAQAVAADPAVAPTPTPVADPGASAAQPVVAAVEPGTVPEGTAEVAKLAGASTPTAKSASSVDTKANGGSVVAPGTEPTPAEGEPAAPSEADVPAAAIDPTPTPAPVEEAKPAAPPPITYVDFAGNYRYSGGNTQREALAQAIEDAVLQLAMPIRGIGRKRLTNTNPIDDTLEIVVTGDKVQTIFETGFDAECVIDGGTVHWTSKKGDKYKVRVRKKDSKIVQVIEGEDGVKTTVFVLSSDKQSLTVHHKITADRLEEPMTYKLSYKRK
jgi:hypothetical protein